MKYLITSLFFLVALIFFISFTFIGYQSINAQSDMDPNKPIIGPAPDPERYSPGRTLSPIIGSHQAFDNEAAIQAAQTSIYFDKAETQLFKLDQQTATTFFADNLKAYQDSQDKQMDANTFHDKGTDRLKDSATSFRDFHSARATVMNEHLTQFPTEKKLYQGCKERYAPLEEDNSVYELSMEETKKHYEDEFDEPPENAPDRCQDVIDLNRDFAIKNAHVPEELEIVVGDSVAVVQGMEDALEVLNDPNRNMSEKFKLVSQNPVWGILNARREALEKCEEQSCLDAATKLLQDLTEYEDSHIYGGPLISRGNQDLRDAIAGKKFDSSYFDMFKSKSQSGDFSKFKNYVEKKFSNAPIINSSTRTSSLGKNRHSSQSNINAKQTKENELVEDEKGNLKLKDVYYNKTKEYRPTVLSDGSVRGTDGILRTKTGKIVKGHEWPIEANIFQIISTRYKKKYFEELGEEK